MPVLKKINGILYSEYAAVVWQDWMMVISPTKYPIEAVHDQVVEFIKWYNK
jgi:hypothetical protein